LVDVGVVRIDVPLGAEPQQAVLLCQAPDMYGDPTCSFWHLFASSTSCPRPTILSLPILSVADFGYEREAPARFLSKDWWAPVGKPTAGLSDTSRPYWSDRAPRRR
jgi:hypothetical protein